MDPRQKVVIWVGSLLITAMGLYPPWACVGTRGIGAAVGYHWLFLPPKAECLAANVDFPRLLIQWVIVGAVSAALFWVWPFAGTALRLKAWLKNPSVQASLQVGAGLVMFYAGAFFAIVHRQEKWACALGGIVAIAGAVLGLEGRGKLKGE